jgi:outer membrane receptor for ferrienterochelin and colicins
VVTAQYAPSKADESMHKITVIDSKKIEQMGAVNLRDVLSNSMNIRLSQDNVLGSSMSLQGISGENVKILVDGVPIIGRQNGNIDLSQINLQNIERIEIVEGPLSVQYGTNALAGTINLISKARSNTYKRKVNVLTQYECIGQYNTSVHGQYSFKKSSINASFGRNYFDGWSNRDKPFSYVGEAKADTNRFQTWKPKEQYMVDLGYAYRFGNMTLAANTGYFNEQIINRGKPLKPYYEKAFDDYYHTKRFDNHLSLNGKLSKNWSLNALAAYNYYQRNKYSFFTDLTTLNKTQTAASDQDTSMFDLLMSRTSFVHAKDSSHFQYELGYDLNHENAVGKRIENKRKTIGDYAVFGTFEYKIKSFTLKPGLRYAYNTQYNSPLVPSLNLKFSPSASHVFRASYARGFRAPSIKELYFDFVDINHNIIGSKDLVAEQSHNFSASWMHRINYGEFRLQTDVSGFYNTIDNLITLAILSGTRYSYVNISKHKTQGVRLLLKTNYKGLELNAGTGAVGRYNQLSESADAPTFSYSPEVNGSVSYLLAKPNITLSAFYKYNGKLPSYEIADEKLKQTFISPYSLMDVSVQKSFWQNRLAITIGCKNVLNVINVAATQSGGAHSSANSSMAIGSGRNFFVKLVWNILDK